VDADLTTSAVSEGKVRTHARDRRPVPRGWLVDRDWAPVTDAAQLYASPRTANIAPLGDGVGYKGFALAFAAEVIGGILTGLGHAGPQPPRQDGNAATFVALRSELLGRPLASIRRDVERLVEHCESRPVAHGFASVRVPGRHEGGAMPTEIEIDETTLDELERLRRAPDDCEAS
jgi:LDH2 family malate/lactate/ureidoglycolate dehydrogenase